MNFARSGPLTKMADSWVMYLNASMQGLDKTVRTLKAHPVRTLRRTAEMLAGPTVLLWLLNKDNLHYQDLNERTKDTYFIIPNLADRDESGNAKTFIKLPKSREWGAIMSATVERGARVLDGESPEEAFRGLEDAFMDSYGLSNPGTENALAPLYYNLATNKDFAGRTIVPQRMQDLEPQYQYDYTTSGISKWIGEKAAEIPLPLPDFVKSPMQMDYLLDQYTGFVGDMVLPMTSGTNKGILETLMSPLERSFTANPLYSSGVTDRFYDELDKATVAARTRNFAEDVPAALQTPEEIYLREMNRAQASMGELRDEEHLLNQADINTKETMKALREKHGL